MYTDILYRVSQKLIHRNEHISYNDAIEICNLGLEEIIDLVILSSEVTSANHEKGVYLCSIMSVRTGACPEDCSFCAQSIFNRPLYPYEPFREPGEILQSAIRAEKEGASEFCIVSSGRGPGKRTMEKVMETIGLLRRYTGLSVGCSLGILSEEQAYMLASAGVRRYNHNLETSKSFFPKVCSTHEYDARVNTAMLVKQHGIELCCGGIFGIGESWQDRIELAFSLRELDPEVVPINFLNPREGSLLQNKQLLEPVEAIKIISIFRLVMPGTILLCGGGRETVLQDFQSFMITAGINSLITGDYLTTSGDPEEKDIEMINKMGLRVLRYN